MSTVELDHPDPDSVPVRDAATVMLLRDAERGLEVCMLQRNLASDFVGGAYVFPGGAVDDDDRDPRTLAVCRGRTDEQASRLVGSERGGLGFWVAAIRESFEEAGVLLATDAAGQPLRLDDTDQVRRFGHHRVAVDSGRRSIAEICVEEELLLDVASLHYFSRWVTPLGAPRRYDTRFFVAAAPEQQLALHEGREVVGTRWLTPSEALHAHASGAMTMIFPTVRTMVALERFERAEQVLDHAAAQAEVEPVLPMLRDEGGGMRLVLPGDPEGTGGVYDAVSGEPLALD